MSLLAVQGGATGTGTVTLLAPITNTNRTLTLPDATGTVLSTATAGVPVNGPAFSAYQSSAQTLTANTVTKVQFQTEEFDTNSAFDSTTNYRFTPTVAGYYQVNSVINSASGGLVTGIIYIYKNGSNFKQGSQTALAVGSNNGLGPVVSALVYLNGSTDYVEIYGLYNGTATLSNTAAATYFQASMIRSAV